MKNTSFQPIFSVHDAITDSPLFRSSVYRYDQQLERLEQWLDTLSRQLKLYTEKITRLNMETIALAQVAFPEDINEMIIDPHFTGAVMKGFADALQTSLSFKTNLVSALEESLITPLQQFLKTHLKDFKSFRKQHEKALEKYESQLAKYSALSKSKEPSSIREEAFRLHEARKLYVKMSGQHTLRILNLRSLLEHTIVDRFSAASMAYENFYDDVQIWTHLNTVISSWKQWLIDDKHSSMYQLRQQHMARKKLEDEYLRLTAPVRDIGRYVSLTQSLKTEGIFSNSKWGYLFIKMSRHTWTRKWCFIHREHFGTSVILGEKGGLNGSSSMSPASSASNKNNLHHRFSVLCDARIPLLEYEVQVPFDSERRFCFELIQPNDTTSILLQAETDEDMMEWIRIISKNKELARRSKVETPTIKDSVKSILSLEQGEDKGTSVVMISTIPDEDISLTNAYSLTPLMVWEASFIHRPCLENSSSAWGIPWSLVPVMVDPTDLDTNTTGISRNDQHEIWPAKHSAIVDIPQIQGYTDELNDYNQELRRLFAGVESTEVVLNVFSCSLRKKPSTLGEISIENSKSVISCPIADIYENELAVTLSQCQFQSPSQYGYAYAGHGFITQNTLWFYSCVSMTCIHSIAIHLKDIEHIEMIRDTSIEKFYEKDSRFMSDNKNLCMAISISFASAHDKPKEPIILSNFVEDVEMVVEKLRLGVYRAKNTNPIGVQNLFDDILDITSRVPITIISRNSVKRISSVSRSNTLRRPHAATVGVNAKVNIRDILKNGRGDSEPSLGLNKNEEVQAEVLSRATASTPIANTPVINTPPLSTHAPIPLNMSAPISNTPSEPVECKCDDHFERQDAQIRLPISAKQCFEMLFTPEDGTLDDNHLWANKLSAILGHDLAMGEWEIKDGKSQRILKYWTPISNPMVRLKEAEVIETQTILNKEDPSRYTVLVTTKMAALPYADAFVPSIKYCITWVSPTECLFTAYIGIKWLKNIFVKAVVSKAALKGVSDSITAFIPILEKTVKGINSPPQRIELSDNGVPLPNAVINSDENRNTSVIAPPIKLDNTSSNNQKTIPTTTETDNTRSFDIMKMYHSFASLIKRHTTSVSSVLLVVLTVYFLWQWTRISSMMDAHNNRHNRMSRPSIPSKSVYLRDLEDGIITHNSSLPYARDKSFKSFLKTKEKLGGFEYQWFNVDHYRLALDLEITREHVALLRHDVLVTFKVLNKLDAHFLENEYINWLLDTQLRCQYNIDDETPCTDITAQLGQFF
ncbi:hypothetical protein BDB01DRAFT_853390 [Pilobolus umbonatus]|nr:hypothetical protein BDB01DRAFT_853390 [Pilobolus umbonatus]